MLLACARHIVTATCKVRNGKWPKKELKGIELYGKTIGIIGCGRVGKEVAKRAEAFGMRVMIYDPYKKEKYPNLPLNELLRQADIITLHVPLTEETLGMIGEKEFNMMKKGVIFINTSRGPVVDERALIKALRSGKIYAAGLDVFSSEPPNNKELLSSPNLVLTPHIGANTYEAQRKISIDVAKIILDFCKRL